MLALVVAAGIGLALLVDFQAVRTSLVPAPLQVRIVGDRTSGEHPLPVVAGKPTGAWTSELPSSIGFCDRFQ